MTALCEARFKLERCIEACLRAHAPDWVRRVDTLVIELPPVSIELLEAYAQRGRFGGKALCYCDVPIVEGDPACTVAVRDRAPGEFHDPFVEMARRGVV